MPVGQLIMSDMSVDILAQGSAFTWTWLLQPAVASMSLPPVCPEAAFIAAGGGTRWICSSGKAMRRINLGVSPPNSPGSDILNKLEADLEDGLGAGSAAWLDHFSQIAGAGGDDPTPLRASRCR